MVDFRDNSMSMIDKIKFTIEHNRGDAKILQKGKFDDENLIIFRADTWSYHDMVGVFHYCGIDMINMLDNWRVEELKTKNDPFRNNHLPVEERRETGIKVCLWLREPLENCQHNNLIYRRDWGRNVCQYCGMMFEVEKVQLKDVQFEPILLIDPAIIEVNEKQRNEEKEKRNNLAINEMGYISKNPNEE